MLAVKKKTYLLAIILAIVIAGSMPFKMFAQICECASNLCCSEYGYCGAGRAYCGQGCRQGPCYRIPAVGGGGVNVASVVTQEFFNSIINQADDHCQGKSFYTRAAFLNALNFYSEFGKTGSSEYSRREISAFFAHATLSTGHFCLVEMVNGTSKDYCNEEYRQYPCARGKKYHGREPLQLSWSSNYGAAGKSIGFDGLNDPDIVGRDLVVSFKASLWFWMNKMRPFLKNGFGATIKAINEPECNGGEQINIDLRIRYYKDYCNRFGVAPGNNLSC